MKALIIHQPDSIQFTLYFNYAKNINFSHSNREIQTSLIPKGKYKLVFPILVSQDLYLTNTTQLPQ